MRVLFVNATRTWGGIKTWMLDLGAFLAGRGHDVAFACRPGNPLAAACADRNLACHAVAFGPDYSPRAVTQFLRLLAADRTDVLVTNITKDLRTAGVAAALRGVAHVNRLGGYGDLRDGWRNRVAYRFVDRVIVPSRSLADHLEALSFLRGKLQVLPNAVTVPAFADKRGTPVRCAVIANLNATKQVDQVIAACAGMRDRPWELHIAGGGPERDALIRQAAGLGVSDRVRFAGVGADGGFRRIDPAAFLADKHVGILFSRSETFGLAILEYFAHGCAVVASRTGGVPEIVTDGHDGLLVDPGDTGALRAALAALLGDEGRRAALARAGYDTARRRFDPSQVFGAVEASLEAARDRRRARAS